MVEEPHLKITLIEAALRLLEASGAEPSLRAVARAAGVSAMAPYNHFADKAALLAAVANQGFENLSQALRRADDNPKPADALMAQGLAFVDFARSNPALFRLMYGNDYGNADIRAVQQTYIILADRIAQVISADVNAATLAARSLVQGMAMVILNRRLSPATPEDIPIAIRFLVRGLEAVERERANGRQSAAGFD